MLGRDLDRFAQAQRVSFHRAGIALLALALVGDQYHRLVGAARKIGKGAIVRRQPGARVDHEHQGVGEADRGLGLFLHPRGQRALGALVEARGIDDREFEIAETALSFAAVARDAGLVIHQRKLLSDQPIEQRRFSDIGPADNGNRKGHKRSRRADLEQSVSLRQTGYHFAGKCSLAPVNEMKPKLTREGAARQRRREWRSGLLRRLRRRRRWRRLIGRRRGGAAADDLLWLGSGRRRGGAALFLRRGIRVWRGCGFLRGSRAGGRRLLALALRFRGVFRFRLLGRRSGGGRRRRLGVLLIDLLLRGALVQTFRHALLEARHTLGKHRLAFARQLFLGVEEIEQIGRIETAHAAGAAGQRARQRDDDCSCDQTLRAAHGRFLTQLFFLPSAFRDWRKQRLQRLGARAQAWRRLPLIGNQIQPPPRPPRIPPPPTPPSPPLP